MELDVYIPELHLAIEYQGEQHYKTLYFSGDQSQQRKRDEEKWNACKKAGITLVEVPYWWDCSIASLAATISNARPELVELM